MEEDEEFYYDEDFDELEEKDPSTGLIKKRRVRKRRKSLVYTVMKTFDEVCKDINRTCTPIEVTGGEVQSLSKKHRVCYMRICPSTYIFTCRS